MENNNEGKIKKIILNEVAFIITICSALAVCILFITGHDAQLQQDVALIKQSIETIETNHLKHIEDDINFINEKDKEQDKILKKISESLVRIETILDGSSF